MAYFVYVLESEVDRHLYIGITQDLTVRLKRHNAGLVRSTKSRRPFRVVGSRQCDSFEQAREVEVRLKSYKDAVRVREWIAQPQYAGA